jgi:hypothetical protein
VADRNQTKAERRQAAGGQSTKGERKQAKLRRKQRDGSAAQATEPTAGGSSPDGIERRLARLEDAVATQAELSEQVLVKLDEVLHEARKSARHAKTVVSRADDEDQQEPGQGI